MMVKWSHEISRWLMWKESGKLTNRNLVVGSSMETSWI
jgi:hypothetical protein